jgi:hypothetical protein
MKKFSKKKDPKSCAFPSYEKYVKWRDEIKAAWAKQGEKCPKKGEDLQENKALESAFRRRSYLSKKFVLLTVDNQDQVIDKANVNELKPPVYIYKAILYDSILKEHKSLGDVGRDRTHKQCAKEYANVTVEAVQLFLKHCFECIRKRRRNTTNIPVTKPIRSSDYLSRYQIDLIDLQAYPDGEYKFILNVQDHFTKFVHLFPLKQKTAATVAWHL